MATQITTLSYDDGDIDTNRTSNPHLNDLVAARYSRRQTLMGGLAAMTTAAFGGVLLSGCNDDGDPAQDVTVSAGNTVTTTAGKTVNLTATASTNATTLAWTQVSGPTVTLTGASTATATFTAPAVTGTQALVFRFTATSPEGKSSSSDTTVNVGPATLDFTAVPKSRADVVSVPAGYTITVLYGFGDPIASGVSAFANDGRDDNFSQRSGDQHDGMHFFGLAASGTAPDPSSNSRGILAINHENIVQVYLHANGPTSTNGVRPRSEVLKEIEAHGMSMVEVSRSAAGTWSYLQTSPLNRRITPFTPTIMSGPARGSALMRTAFSPDGTAGRGTINNCATGYMPWATVLTGEENWSGYFRRGAGDDAVRVAAGTPQAVTTLNRYGSRGTRGGNYGWTTAAPADATDTRFSKFDITADPTKPADGSGDYRNEINQYGWMVEVDPYDPTSAPRKRTALGRFNHEGGWPSNLVAGRRPAFYMGDDAQNEYIYKFVSAAPWAAADATAADRLATGDKYLDTGTLYVAKLNADGSGQWLPLVFGQGPLTSSNATYPFADQADVLINTRIAADLLGATPMDRPEWTAVNPVNGEMYCTLTNNSSRTPANTDAANPRAYTDPKVDGRSPGNGNVNGHVIRFREAGDTSEATTFTWDVYVFGAGSDLDPANINLSGLDATNDFSSPDGLWFSRPSNVTGQGLPIMWIQTDDGSYTDVTNCMMLAAIPGRVGDGDTRTITNTIGTATGTATTRVGKAPGASLKRFLVGPRDCEVTGVDTTPDGKTLFVNIQHPGENGNLTNFTSSWPASQAGASGTSRPRSATIVITKNDGGIVGI